MQQKSGAEEENGATEKWTKQLKNGLQVNQYQFGDRSCQHQVLWPAGTQGDCSCPQKVDKVPAKEYPFQIDPFQQVAINCLEKGQSVLVAAHTSAGKTVIAQYALALGIRDNTRVIYTSPLKALSNQKYREFVEEFSDVGLVTGDVSINPSAPLLVMTTEIYRQMLYKGSTIVREVRWVIYDEVHYLKDPHRGVVWEEAIIHTPPTAGQIYLSATIPNAPEFAQWVADVSQQPCHVVYTDYRPTPLQHYLFPAGAEGLFLVMSESSKFHPGNFKKAVACLHDNDTNASRKKSKPTAGVIAGKPGDQPDIFRLVHVLMERNYAPVIVFSFSKRECESLALALGGLDVNSKNEKSIVGKVFNAAMDALSSADKKLPQITHILPMLKRGVGVHHSGLLPIVKEVIEVLFQEGLIKVLFATETFSTGLNMPAKTVVFTNSRKFDGGTFRWLTSGEYIQMSGRAGRRGLDDKGIVVMMLDQRMDPSVARGMLTGKPDKLTSSFSLSYNMILAIQRLETATHTELISKSFRQFQQRQCVPELTRRMEGLQALVDEYNNMFNMQARGDTWKRTVDRLDALFSQLRVLDEQVHRVQYNAAHGMQYMQPGRLVRVRQAPQWTNSTMSNMTNGFADSQGQIRTNHRTPDPHNILSYLQGMKVVDSSGGKWNEGVDMLNTALRDACAQLHNLTTTTVAGNTSGETKKGKKAGAGDDWVSLGVSADVLYHVHGARDEVWGVIVGKGEIQGTKGKRKHGDGSNNEDHGRVHVVQILVMVDADSRQGEHERRLLQPWHAGQPVVVAVPYSRVNYISSVRLYMPKDIRAPSDQQALMQGALSTVQRLSAAGNAATQLQREDTQAVRDDECGGLDWVAGLSDDVDGWGSVLECADVAPIEQLQRFLKSEEGGAKKLVKKMKVIKEMIHEEISQVLEEVLVPQHGTKQDASTCVLTRRVVDTFARGLQIKRVTSGIKDTAALLKRHINDAKGIIFEDELAARLRIVQRLGYIKDDGVVSMKGHVACEITAADQLLIVEILFSGMLQDTPIYNSIALMSCLVWTEKQDKPAAIPDSIQPLITQLKQHARNIAQISKESQLPDVDVESYVDSFRPDLIPVVLAWYQGAPFANIVKMSQVFEGSLVRAIRRLEELLGQLVLGCRLMGDAELANKIEEGRTKIKRDVIFAASLYL